MKGFLLFPNHQATYCVHLPWYHRISWWDQLPIASSNSTAFLNVDLTYYNNFHLFLNSPNFLQFPEIFDQTTLEQILCIKGNNHRSFWQWFCTQHFLCGKDIWAAMEGYCVKCKSKRSMNEEKKVTMKNGKPATQGICSVCGTKMFRIGK